jgi:hypothetical protein
MQIKTRSLLKCSVTKKPSETRKPFFNILFYLIIIGGIQHDGLATRPSSVELSAIG